MTLHQFLFDRLWDRGVRHIYGIPGDFALNLFEALEPALRQRRQVVGRQRKAGHTQLVKDYFSETLTYLEAYFRRRFRMSRRLFVRFRRRRRACSSRPLCIILSNLC